MSAALGPGRRGLRAPPGAAAAAGRDPQPRRRTRRRVRIDPQGFAPVGTAGDGGAIETASFPRVTTDMSEAKRLAGEKAIDYVEDGSIVGVGTGSTFAYFIDSLGRIRHRIAGAVSSSEQSTARLRGHGIEVLELNDTGPLALYVDGADECDPGKCLIKGGGAALTREKIIAQACEKFVCIIDPAKRVDVLGDRKRVV